MPERRNETSAPARKKGKKAKADSAKPTKKMTQKKAAKPAAKASILEAPAAVRRALEKGLDLRGEYGGKGLVPTTITWAKKLAKGAPITPQKARKMHAYFARHAVDKRPHWDKPPTPGYVAWLLWGGDAARTWVNKVLKSLDED